MISLINKQDCCGCEACVSVCPVKCISLAADEEGFEYPQVKENACTHCGKCIAVCPFLNENMPKSSEMEIYGAWNKDEKIRFESSSGGIFIELARYIIRLKGIVFGAVLEKDNMVAHRYVTEESQIFRFCKSKYVQSRIGTSYVDAKYFLEKGRPVLFSGTPCQISALHKFLGGEYENLYTVDVICVGTPSPGVWRAYIEQVEKENGSKIRNVIFRHKEIEPAVLKAENRNLTIKIEFQNGRSLYQYFDKNEFFGGFLSKLFLRPSCGKCKAKKFSSGSDIQLGDFWEIERIYPEVLPFSNDNKRIPFGVSEVLIHSAKGKKLFGAIQENIISFRADLWSVKKAQTDTNWFLLEHSSQQHWNRKHFFDEFAEDHAHVKETIRRNLGLRNLEYMSGKTLGMWGSFQLRESIRLITGHTDCALAFQFRNSTIYSLMSEAGAIENGCHISQNPFRDKMLKADITKEFRKNLNKYLGKIDFLFLDLLEERYGNMLWDGVVLTKSEGYFENVNMQGVPLEVPFEKWKESIESFITLILRYIDCPQIIFAENYLCNKYGKINAPKYKYTDYKYINLANQSLHRKYSYVKSRWPEITVLPQLPEDLQFTEIGHVYGCVCEHANDGAYAYVAQKIAEAVRDYERTGFKLQ